MDDDIEDYCDLYSSAGLKYQEMKKALIVDLEYMCTEIENDNTDDILNEVSNAECKGKRKPRKPKYGNENELGEQCSENTGRLKRTHSDIASISSDDSTCNQRNKRRGRPRKNPEQNNIQSSTNQRIIGPTIVLDPDSPISTTTPIIADHITLSDSDEDIITPQPICENEEIHIKVWWQFGRFDKFNIRRFQKLTPIFEHYSQLMNVPTSQILLLVNDTPIQSNDTPDSLKLTSANIIEGGITSSRLNNTAAPEETQTFGENEIELKILRKGHKKPLLLHIEKNQRMQVLMWKCAETLELSYEKLKFYFDGETLNPNETPVDLDLEGGECIDLHVLD